jgi:hypothetical protein
MHRLERPIVYGALFLLGWAALARTSRVSAEAPEDGRFGVVTVTELRVVALDGTVLARIGGTDAGGVVSWSAKGGKPAGELSTNPNGGQLSILNADGKQVLFAGTATDNPIGVVSVNEKGGARRVALIGSADAAGHFYNTDGKIVAYVGSSAQKSGLMYVTTPAGARAVEVGLNAQGGHVLTTNLDGKQTVFLGTATDTSNGILSLNRKDGTRSVMIGP